MMKNRRGARSLTLALLAAAALTGCTGGGADPDPNWTPTGTGDAMTEYLQAHPEARASLLAELERGLAEAAEGYDEWAAGQASAYADDHARAAALREAVAEASSPATACPRIRDAYLDIVELDMSETRAQADQLWRTWSCDTKWSTR